MPFAERTTLNTQRLPAKVRIWGVMLLVALSCTAACYSFAAAEQPGPADVIKGFNAVLLESMKRAGELGYTGRYKLMEPVIKKC